MANPYTRNVRYNYKPIDMTEIGKAAVQNQKNYDFAGAAIDDFDVSIDSLSEQKGIADKATQGFRSEMSAIAEELKVNKDSRSAMSKMRNLNKRYKRYMSEGDGAILAGNVAIDKEWRKRQQAKNDKGTNESRYSDQWYNMERSAWGKGAIVDGKPTSLSLRDMSANKSKEMKDHGLNLAKLPKAQIIERLGGYKYIDGFNKQQITSKISTLSGTELTDYINTTLQNTQEFQGWFADQKELIQYRNSGMDGEAFYNKEASGIDEELGVLQSRIDNPKTSEEDKNKAQGKLDQLKSRKKQYTDYLTSGEKGHNADALGKMLYGNQQFNSITRGAAMPGMLRNTNDRTIKVNTVTDHGSLAQYKDGLVAKREREVNVVESIGETYGKYQGTSSVDLNANIQELENITDKTQEDLSSITEMKKYRSLISETFNEQSGDMYTKLNEELKTSLGYSSLSSAEQNMVLNQGKTAAIASLNASRNKDVNHGQDVGIDNKIFEINSIFKNNKKYGSRDAALDKFAKEGKINQWGNYLIDAKSTELKQTNDLLKKSISLVSFDITDGQKGLDKIQSATNFEIKDYGLGAGSDARIRVQVTSGTGNNKTTEIISLSPKVINEGIDGYRYDDVTTHLLNKISKNGGGNMAQAFFGKVKYNTVNPIFGDITESELERSSSEVLSTVNPDVRNKIKADAEVGKLALKQDNKGRVIIVESLPGGGYGYTGKGSSASTNISNVTSFDSKTDAINHLNSTFK
jgi:hypothetical protein